MKYIVIDDDIYDYLLANIRVIGEQPGPILRRLLELPARTRRTHRKGALAQKRTARRRHELSAALDRSGWQPFDVGHYLYLLGVVQQQHSEDFFEVREIRGRSRLYFARSAGDIEKSGTMTKPQRIPGSPFWTITNIPTREKQRILRNVLIRLGYTEDAMLAARDYLARGNLPPSPVP